MSDDIDDLRLVPISGEETRRQAKSKQELLVKAAELIRFEEICAEEERLRDLAVKDLGSQFGIRHVAMLTAATALTIALFQNVGMVAGLCGGFIASVVLLLYFVEDWLRQRKKCLMLQKKALKFQGENGRGTFERG